MHRPQRWRYPSLVLTSVALGVYCHAAIAGCADSSDVGIPTEAEPEAGGDDMFADTGDTGDTGEFGSGTGDVGEDDTTGSGSTSGAPNQTSSSSGGGPGDCCVASATPGCNDASIEQCVCAQDDYCCNAEWNDLCVEAVDAFGCGSCGGGTSGSSGATSGGNPGGDCCTPGMAPGCADPNVEQCVCAQDDYCCMTAWDDQCVGEVDSFGCGSCGGGPSGSSSGGSSGGNPPGQCCVESAMPGCGDPNVEQCVCSQDAYCCDVAWDDICVNEILLFGCGICQ